MTGKIERAVANPIVMQIKRAGDGIGPAPDGIASGPFQAQTLLSSEVDGEMTAMRAFVPPSVVTNWHSHPRGQLLFVLDGVGLVQREGGDVIEIGTGDSVFFAPGERHWHGAAASGPFNYISIQPIKDGVAVRWLEPVGNSMRL